jgi:hypothetical protein
LKGIGAGATLHGAADVAGEGDKHRRLGLVGERMNQAVGIVIGVVTILVSIIAIVARERIAESWYAKKQGSPLQELYSSSTPLLVVGIVGVPLGFVFLGIASLTGRGDSWASSTRCNPAMLRPIASSSRGIVASKPARQTRPYCPRIKSPVGTEGRELSTVAASSRSGKLA